MSYPVNQLRHHITLPFLEARVALAVLLDQGRFSQKPPLLRRSEAVGSEELYRHSLATDDLNEESLPLRRPIPNQVLEDLLGFGLGGGIDKNLYGRACAHRASICLVRTMSIHFL